MRLRRADGVKRPDAAAVTPSATIDWRQQTAPPVDRDRRSTDYCGVSKRLPDGKIHRCHKQPGHDDKLHVCWCGHVESRGPESK